MGVYGFCLLWWLYERKIGFWRHTQDNFVESCKTKQTLSVPLCQFVYVLLSEKMEKYSQISPSGAFVWTEHKSSHFSHNELTSELIKGYWKRTGYTKKDFTGSQDKETKCTKRNYHLGLASSPAVVSVWRTMTNIFKISREMACEPMVYIYPSYLLSIKTMQGMQ